MNYIFENFMINYRIYFQVNSHQINWLRKGSNYNISSSEVIQSQD